MWANPDEYSGRCDVIDGFDWIKSEEDCAQAAQALGFCDTSVDHRVHDSDNPKGCWFGGGGGCCMGSYCGSLYFNSGEGGPSHSGRTSLCKIEDSSSKRIIFTSERLTSSHDAINILGEYNSQGQ